MKKMKNGKPADSVKTVEPIEIADAEIETGVSTTCQTFKPVDQPSCGRSRAKHLLLSQREQVVHVGECIEELSSVFIDQLNSCREIDVPVALLLIEVTNFDELGSDGNEPGAEEVVNEIARSLLKVLRGQDIVIQYGKRYIAAMLVDADQIVGARICQRIKECIYRYSYFHHAAGAIEVVFGVSDNSESRYAEIEPLMFSAARALNVALGLGDGAIVRTSDLDQTTDMHSREHFLPGDRLSSKS